MPFRHHDKGDEQPRTLEVDHGLEDALLEVEAAVSAHLERGDVSTHERLVGAVAALDAVVAASEAFHWSATEARPFGVAAHAGLLTSVGQTSLNAPVDEIPAPELQAQAELVKAAKAELVAPTMESHFALGAALDALRSMHGGREGPAATE